MTAASPIRRILVINGNPDPSTERLTSALASAYIAGAQSTSHDVRRIDVGALTFPFLRAATEFAAPPVHPDIVAARQDFLWADHLVVIYPIWLGSAPALLKAFMEWIACGEFFLATGGGGWPKGKLKGRSARQVVTLGMPAIAYRLFFGAHGARAFASGILRLAGIAPLRTTYFGGAGISPNRSRKWLDRLHKLGTMGA